MHRWIKKGLFRPDVPGVSLPSNKRRHQDKLVDFPPIGYRGDGTTWVSRHIPMENTCPLMVQLVFSQAENFCFEMCVLKWFVWDLRCFEGVEAGGMWSEMSHYHPQIQCAWSSTYKKLLYALIKTVFRLHILNDPQRKAPMIRLL